MTTTVFSSSVVSNGSDPIFTYAASGDGLIVESGVTLSLLGSAGAAVFAPGLGPAPGLADLYATINGTVSTPFASAIDASGSSIDLTVGRTGRLESAGIGFVASGDSTVTNRGVIEAGDIGVYNDDSGDSAVENWGSISGGETAVSFAVWDSPDSRATLVNRGTLESGSEANIWSAAAYSSADATFIANYGSIVSKGAFVPAVKVYDRDYDPTDPTTIYNAGTIRSDQYYGVIAGGSGDFTLVNDGTIGGAYLSLWLGYAGGATVTNNGLLDGRAELGGGDDIFHGEQGRVAGSVWGQAGDDLLVGGASADVLAGGSGDDTVTGGGGADTLTGASGADLVSGGGGEDVLRFGAAADSLGDMIVASGGALAFEGAGAAGGDRIDVSAIDANASLAGNQAFVFGTSQGLGRLWAVDVDDVTHVRGNVTGDTAPEFDLAIADGAGVQAADYAGIDFIL